MYEFLPWIGLGVLLLLCLPILPIQHVVLVVSSWVLRVALVGLLASGAYLWFRPGNMPASVWTILADFPGLIALLAVPIIIQSYGIFLLTYAAAYAWRVPFPVAAPCALIGTSNFFELAVAVAIGLFGLGSGAALATVVGVLVEVPVMLSLVAFANRTRGKFEARATF